ncbi:erythromycin esterase family protein [Salmonirosea aquatica]|uniref:Erythromycin esterase family protein n=1 Tax=Salmonirosea aquatica TaxID=2654236 RepID=A0A7C9FRJ4_9BACT|nr:hypothetical protein [Cytophagaceae bacterium SJW1-29]
MTKSISLGRRIIMGCVFTCILSQGTLAQTTVTELVGQKESPNFRITDLGESVPFGLNKNLDPLLSVLEKKKLLLIGEPTHGAANVYLFKYDLFKELVGLNRVKCLLIEANFNSVLKLDDFVSGCTPMDSLASGLNKMPFMHRTEEFKDLMLWMRAYNASKEPHEHVHIYGIDVQDVDAGFDFIKKYFSKTDKSYADSLSSFLPTMTPNKLPEWRHNVYTEAQLEDLQKHLEAVKKKAASKSESQEWQLATRVLENIRLCSHMYTHPRDFKRDLYMAENVKWILNLERKDMGFVVSAHNGHVANDGGLGTYLKEALADEVYTLGVDFGEGQIMAVSASPDTVRSFKAHDVLFLEADSISLAHLSDRVRFIQPVNSKNDVIIRSSGATYNQKRSQVYWRTVSLPGSFDSIVYFDRVYPSTVLPISR